MIRCETGVIYDESIYHKLYSSNEENPQRTVWHTSTFLEKLNLIDKCKVIPSRRATKEEVLTTHDEKTFSILQSTAGITEKNKIECIDCGINGVYIHPSIFDFSLLRVGSTVDLVYNIVNSNVQNGIAIFRSTEYKSKESQLTGYPFFNNIAIATNYCLNGLNLKRILIIDLTAHRDQTHALFYNDPRVLTFSIKHFESDDFHTNSSESRYDLIGKGYGTGFHFNIPLPKKITQMEDICSIFQQILLPVAFEVT